MSKTIFLHFFFPQKTNCYDLSHLTDQDFFDLAKKRNKEVNGRSWISKNFAPKVHYLYRKEKSTLHVEAVNVDYANGVYAHLYPETSPDHPRQLRIVYRKYQLMSFLILIAGLITLTINLCTNIRYLWLGPCIILGGLLFNHLIFFQNQPRLAADIIGTFRLEKQQINTNA